MAANYLFFSLWLLASVRSSAHADPDFQPAWIGVTVIILLGMLATAGVAFVRLRNLNNDLTTTDHWLVQAPAYIYYAWLNVAAIANITAYLQGIGWGVGTGETWALVLLVVTVLLTSAMILYTRASVGTAAYTSVIVWALVGIYVQNQGVSTPVAVGALVAAVLVAAVMIYRFTRPPRLQQASLSLAS